MNLSELIKTTAEISDSRYSGDFQISRIGGIWKVAFHKKNQNGGGFAWIQVVDNGLTLEAALKEACRIELDKAETELSSVRDFLKKVKK